VGFGIIGPYLFGEEHTVTVTSHCYVETLRNFLEPRLNELGNVWFQHDGATPHKARALWKF
jgi:hypothetical protein